MLFYLNTKNQSQAKIIRNLFRSYEGEKELQATIRFSSNQKVNDRAKTIVFAGILRGEGLIYRYCQTNNKNFLYVDHAYLERGYQHNFPDKEWMRITYNNFNWSLNQTEPADRWNQYFYPKYDLSAWNNKNGTKILVLPPSEATKSLFPESAKWTENAIEEIKKRTSAPIRIREKPVQPIVDLNTNQVISHKNIIHEKNIEAELLDAKL